ncbi:helix-turn-helix transcriptional regulator [bacterium]|nr:helix-turn-helix transcriptional regulator [bacterium]
MISDKSIKRELSKKIGVAIKHYRSNKNLSQEKLAFAIGVDRTYISALELGNKIASVYCLYKLSKALDVNLKDLFNFTV